MPAVRADELLHEEEGDEPRQDREPGGGLCEDIVEVMAAVTMDVVIVVVVMVVAVVIVVVAPLPAASGVQSPGKWESATNTSLR